ncbi:hypothetical protein MMC28_007713 [Mycoblastus sanguinarius]|nr:hypothetical protein [Mycoblastus sanguinarius]
MTRTEEPQSTLATPSLPLEILRQVFAFLTRKDLISLRLTSRHFYNVASEILFHAITIENNQFSQNQLKEISSSPSWAHQVHHIHWTPFEPPGHRVYPGSPCFDVSLQCQYLGELPRVKAVRFSNIALWAMSTPDLFLRQSSKHDLYEVLQRAQLKPETIQIGNVLTNLAYSSDGYLEKLEVRTGFEGPESTERVHSSSLGPSSIFSPASEPDISFTFPNHFLALESVVSSENKTLKQVTMMDVSVSIAFLKGLLSSHRQLTNLSLVNVLLATYTTFRSDDFLIQLLKCIKSRAEQPEVSNVAVTLTNIHKIGFRGSFTAKDEELADWLENGRDDWLVQAQVAFTPLTAEDYGDRWYDEL